MRNFETQAFACPMVRHYNGESTFLRELNLGHFPKFVIVFNAQSPTFHDCPTSEETRLSTWMTRAGGRWRTLARNNGLDARSSAIKVDAQARGKKPFPGHLFHFTSEATRCPSPWFTLMRKAESLPFWYYVN